MGILHSIKTSWMNYLNRQAEANKRNFGTTEGLSCCNLQKYDELDKEQALKFVDVSEDGEAEKQRWKNDSPSDR